MVDELLLALELSTLLLIFPGGVLDIQDVLKGWPQVHGPGREVNVSNLNITAYNLNLAINWRLFWV